MHALCLVPALAAFALHGPAFADAPQTAVGYPSVDAARAALDANPEAEVEVIGGWTVYTVPEAPFVLSWVFVPEGHAGHPAVLRVQTLNNNGALYRDVRILCHTKKNVCDALLDEFMMTAQRFLR